MSDSLEGFGIPGKGLARRSLLALSDWSPADVRAMLDVAHELALQRRSRLAPGAALTSAMGFGGQPGRLAGKTLAAIFEKPSTRTRAAFCVAAFEEGALPQCFGPDEIHLGEKESVCDTARVLSRFYGCIAWRGHRHEMVEELSRFAEVPVINLLSDRHHPTQALADGLTMIEEFGSVEGRKLVFFGDVTNNVARSLCDLAAALAFKVTLCGPESLLRRPETPVGPCIEHESDPVRAAKHADVVYTDVWTSMGFAGPADYGDYGSQAETSHVEDHRSAELALRPYQVNAQILQATGKQSTVFLHCLPALRGKEVTDEVMDSAQSRVLAQAENRLHTMKAVLISTCGW